MKHPAVWVLLLTACGLAVPAAQGQEKKDTPPPPLDAVLRVSVDQKTWVAGKLIAGSAQGLPPGPPTVG
jgi:hypothetical protein